MWQNLYETDRAFPNSHMILSAALAISIAQPTVVVVGDTVVAEKTAKGWRSPEKNLHRQKVSLKSWRLDSTVAGFDGEIEYDEGPPMESVHIKGIELPDKDILSVSGNPKFAPVTRISPENPEYKKIAIEYGKSRGRKAVPGIEAGFLADLDGDGRQEALLVIATDASVKKETGFCAIVLRHMSGKKVVTTTLEFNGIWGYMRGPYHGRVYGVGDFDGNGTREFIYTFEDPWGTDTKLKQFKNGKVKNLCTTSWGE